MNISTDQMIPWQDNSRIKQSSIAEPSPGPFNCFSVLIFLNLVSKNLQVNFFCSVIKIVRNNLKVEIKINWIFRTFLNISYNHAIRETIALGGDTDTNAAIVGGMIGALVGKQGI